MDAILATISSRTVWTSVAVVLVNTVPLLISIIPSVFVPVVNAILVLLVAYFHLTPSARSQTFIASRTK